MAKQITKPEINIYANLLKDAATITNYDDFNKSFAKLIELKEYNSLFNNNSNSEEIRTFSNLEKKLGEALLFKEQELTNMNADLHTKKSLISGIDKEVITLDTMCKSLAILEQEALEKMATLEDDIAKEKINIQTKNKALLILGSYFALKHTKNLAGLLLTTYLAGKIMKDLLVPTKENTLDLYTYYLNDLEKYLNDASDIEKALATNLTNIDELEISLKEKYKLYLKEDEFKRFFTLISYTKNNIKEKLNEVVKTKDNLYNNISLNKVKIKRMEEG